MATPHMLPFVSLDLLDSTLTWADRHLIVAVLLVVVIGGAVAFALVRLVSHWLRPVPVPLPPAEPLRITPRPWGAPAPKGFTRTTADRTRAVADMHSRRA